MSPSSNPPIPRWTLSGVLPPIRSGQEGTSADRSPYETTALDLVRHFATSPKRIEMLKGLLQFRKALYDAGFPKGFQWVDGSFTEHIEATESRDPQDMDVVTFYELPTEEHMINWEAAQQLIDREKTRKLYSVDAYFIRLGLPLDKQVVKEISYRQSIWAHRRDWTWKVFLSIDFDANSDEAALKELENRSFSS